jgi:hypothetical protein
VSKTTLFWCFIVYSLPAWYLRYKWRSTIYREPSWRITVAPRMGKDLLSLVSNRYFLTSSERRMAMWVRVYLAGYATLLVAWATRS